VAILSHSADLDPRTRRRQHDAFRRQGFIKGAVAELDGNGAALIIGHQPLLGWMCSDITRAPRVGAMVRWHAGPVPIDSSEVVCVLLRATKSNGKRIRGDVLWTIHPSDKQAADDIREKIKSKMETAKLLAGVMTLVLTALLGVLFDRSKWLALEGCPDGGPAPEEGCLSVAPFGVDTLSLSGQLAVQIAFGLLIAALGLYLMTMYAYDSLLMPSRFWGESPPRGHRRRWLPLRQPSSAAWVLYRNMMRIWYTLFTPATFLVVIALTVLAASLLRLSTTGFWLLAAAVFVLAAIQRWTRPVIGSED